MIEAPTCIILGAGASAPFGLPTAGELRSLMLVGKSPAAEEVANKFPIRGPSRDWLRRHDVPPSLLREWTIYLGHTAKQAGLDGKFQDFQERFFRSGRTIDWFLRYQDERFGDIGRLQLAAVLLMCEREERLFGDWYELLLHQLIPGGPESLEPGKLSVITFNYDRSFERFFRNALEAQYNLNEANARDVFSRVRIKHVYGDLGSLEDVPYGAFDMAQLAASSISLIRDRVDEEIVRRIRPLIQESVYVNFLGFGFDDDNMKLFHSQDFNIRRVYSTNFGLPVTRRNTAAANLAVRFPAGESHQVKVRDLLETTDVFGPALCDESPDSEEEDIGYDIY